MMEIKIRVAEKSDALQLVEIYRPYVEKTAITFEYEVPSKEEFEERIERVKESYPFLVAESEGIILGYAYLGRFRPRKAYDWCAETSIYIKMGEYGKGIGSLLYQKLEAIALAQNIVKLYASIAATRKEDRHLSNGSIVFHEVIGYSEIGRFRDCGYKFETWYDMIWMEKTIRDEYQIPGDWLSFRENMLF